MSRAAISVFSCLLPLTASILKAQSTDQLLKDFRIQILNQRLILRNFSADPVTNFEWTANGLASTPPKVRTLGVFKLSSARIHNDSLELTGSRSTIYKNKNEEPTLLGDTPIVIRIALKGADPALVLPGLKQQLSFPTLQAAIAALPLQDQQMLYPTGEPQHPDSPCSVTGAHYQRLKVIYQEEPEFSEQATRSHLGDSVDISLTVNENGRPSDLWLKKPAEPALDEKVIKAVSNYKFQPATCDGTAVKTPITIEVNSAVR